jgi:hypothetical protein
MRTELYLGVVSVTIKDDMPGLILETSNMEKTSAEVVLRSYHFPIHNEPQ